MINTEPPVEAAETEAYRRLLNHERSLAMVRVQDFRREQYEDTQPVPGDELDVARSLGEAETYASLIERAEARLRAVDDAMQRLAEGRYGACESCGEQIPLERLRTLPFAIYCVDCQARLASRGGEQAFGEPFGSRWIVPPEIVTESLAEQDSLRAPRRRLRMRAAPPSTPEPAEPARKRTIPAGRRGISRKRA